MLLGGGGGGGVMDMLVFLFPVICNFDDSSELDIRLMYISLFVNQGGVRSFRGVSC